MEGEGKRERDGVDVRTFNSQFVIKIFFGKLNMQRQNKDKIQQNVGKVIPESLYSCT